jgi:hypothetical protein
VPPPLPLPLPDEPLNNDEWVLSCNRTHRFLVCINLMLNKHCPHYKLLVDDDEFDSSDDSTLSIRTRTVKNSTTSNLRLLNKLRKYIEKYDSTFRKNCQPASEQSSSPLDEDEEDVFMSSNSAAVDKTDELRSIKLRQLSRNINYNYNNNKNNNGSSKIEFDQSKKKGENEIYGIYFFVQRKDYWDFFSLNLIF